MQPITAQAIDLLKANENIVNAGPMRAYMKNRFAFLGIPGSQRKPLFKPLIKASKNLTTDELYLLVTELYAQEEREFQYAAIDFLNENINRLSNDWNAIAVYLPLIREKAWWDSVDLLRKGIGLWTKKHIDAQMSPMMTYLLSSNDMWDRRVAVTLQLQWKEKTQKPWLERAILKNLHDPEFFIQKGIGWALREFSKTDKAWVRDFLHGEGRELTPLAIREASKYLQD